MDDDVAAVFSILPVQEASVWMKEVQNGDSNLHIIIFYSVLVEVSIVYTENILKIAIY